MWWPLTSQFSTSSILENVNLNGDALLLLRHSFFMWKLAQVQHHLALFHWKDGDNLASHLIPFRLLIMGDH